MREKLEKAINASALDPNVKRALSGSILAIADRQASLHREIRAALENEYSGVAELASFPAYVYTALAERNRVDELRAWNFYEPTPSFIPADKESGAFMPGIIFLKTDYKTFSDLCAKRFTGSSSTGPVEYELCPWFGYVEAERELDLLWQLYGFHTPRVWSPWARRAVRVHPLAPIDSGFNPKLEANGLENIFLDNRTLVWNVGLNAENETVSGHRIAPRDQGMAHIYHYTARDGAAKLWPLPEDVRCGKIDPQAVDADIKQGNIILKSGQAFSSDECRKYIFYENTEPAGLRLFSCKSEPQGRHMPQSRAQFNRLLASFASHGYMCELADGPGEPVPTYALSHRTTHPGQLLLGQAGNHCMHIRFSRIDGDQIFLADYANWVLAELERRIPVIAWRGVY